MTTVYRSEEIVCEMLGKSPKMILLQSNKAKANVTFKVNIFDHIEMDLTYIDVFRSVQPTITGSEVKAFTTDDNNRQNPTLEIYRDADFDPDKSELWCDYTISERSQYKRQFSLKLRENSKYMLQLAADDVKQKLFLIGVVVSWTEEA